MSDLDMLAQAYSDIPPGPLADVVAIGLQRGFVLSTDYRMLDAIPDFDERIAAIQTVGRFNQALFALRLVEAHKSKRPWWRFW